MDYRSRTQQLVTALIWGVVACGAALIGSYAIAQTVNLDGRVPGCGDSIVDVGENCDFPDLSGQTCSSLGFDGGTLSCTAGCLFDTSSCTVTQSGGGGGGGGGGSSLRKTRVLFMGKAHPESLITLLKDAQVVATSTADSDARFQIELSDITKGDYIFSLYGEDIKGYRSSLLAFPVRVKKNVVNTVEGIFIAPTIGLDKKQVRQGDPLLIFGQSAPSALVTLTINSAIEHTAQIETDEIGAYLHRFDTAVLEMGDHVTKSRSLHEKEMSSFSTAQEFVVGTTNIAADPVRACIVRADVNGDCRVNIVDFSIMLYWMHRPFEEPFLTIEREKLSGDGRISIVDLSILAFYWTG